MKVALITGITGQDGYYLSRLLLQKGYQVHGVVRRASLLHRSRIDRLKLEHPELAPHITMHYGDVTDGGFLIALAHRLQPDEIYNLAAQSHVRISFDNPGYTHQVDAIGALNVLEAARSLAAQRPVRVYQASSSEMFGGIPGTEPQSESTPFRPRSPYGCAKVSAFHQTVNHREAFGLFACNGILFNHESPLRGENFVTRKVTLGAARIKLGQADSLVLGNLDARRDWGFAGDYVEAMWRMLQAERADDYVIATGVMHSIRDLLDLAFGHVGLDWRDHVRTDRHYERPTEVDVLLGDSSKARRELGWQPQVDFPQLIRMMVEHDLVHARSAPELLV